VNNLSETGNGECLTEDLISGYLEGVLTPVVKTACEVHLIACDRCREKLAAFMRLLRTDIDPEEEEEIDRAMAKWTRRNLQPVPPVRRPTVWKQVYYGLGGIAAVLVLAILFLWSRPTAEDIVQDLLERDRPFDAQLAGQPYRPLVVTRGPEDDDRFDLLAQEMSKRAADAYRWGRFYLIEGNYEKAIEQLLMAAEDPHAPPDVHNDLGVGYLLRFTAGDFERALSEFKSALTQDETFLPAIFNLSLLYERNGMTEEAAQQGERYLQLDSDSEWAQEVRARLSRKDLDK
jgi:hypothetical protein